MNWRRAHWIVGSLTLLAFPLTGAYMLHMAGVPALDAVPRLIFRARHLFLLLAALANLALAGREPAGLGQRLAGGLVMISPFLLFAAFLVDPTRGLHSSQLFHFAMYGLFAAAALLAITNRS